MKTIRPAGLLVLAALAGCAPPAATSPAQAAARAGATYEAAARNCGGIAGGFGDIVTMRNQANARYALARKLGATDALIAQERKTVSDTLDGAAFMVGKAEVCQKLVTEAAMNAT